MHLIYNADRFFLLNLIRYWKRRKHHQANKLPPEVCLKFLPWFLCSELVESGQLKEMCKSFFSHGFAVCCVKHHQGDVPGSMVQVPSN